MTDILGFSITPDPNTFLCKMLKYNLEPFLEDLESVSAGASKKFSLEKAMQTMEDEWGPILFTTILYRDTGISILTSIDDIQTNLDDQIVKTQTMWNSPFIKPFEARIKEWQERLLNMWDSIDEWLKVGGHCRLLKFAVCHMFTVIYYAIQRYPEISIDLYTYT